MTTVTVKEALERLQSKDERWYVYELDPRARAFCLVDMAGWPVEDVENFLGSGAYLRKSDDGETKDKLDYADPSVMKVESENDDDDDADLSVLFDNGGVEDAYECPTCGRKFSSPNDLFSHEYDTGHSIRSDEYNSNDAFSNALFDCLALLKRMSKKSIGGKFADSVDFIDRMVKIKSDVEKLENDIASVNG